MFYFKIFTYKNSNLKNFFLWHVSSYFYRDIFKGVILLRETKPWVKIRGSERNFCLIYYTQVWYLNFFGTNKLKSLNLELFDKNKRHSSLSLIKNFYLKDWQAYLTCSYTWRFKTTSLYFNFLFSFIFRRRSYFINIMNSSLLNFNL